MSINVKKLLWSDNLPSIKREDSTKALPDGEK